ncbi:hypothetical protein GF357_03930 [Candidatus Dojkabacteria bacterium]|nr:hypothetical protein [Candidatus Dojkabacteria bacterium]
MKDAHIAIEELKKVFQNNPEGLVQVLKSLRTKLEAYERNIPKLVEKRRIVELRKYLHDLKGISGYIKLGENPDYGEEIAKALRDSIDGDILELSQNILKELPSLQLHLAELITQFDR